MDIRITPMIETELDEVSRFLRQVFGESDDWAPFQPEVLRWKALTPHPLWEGSRGCVLRLNGEMAAFGCAAPSRFLREGSETPVACVIDWAADKKMPGGGVMIYQHIAKSTGALIGLGGSDDAQRVVKRMGFQARQEFEVCARVTRPASRLLQTKAKNWRDLARFGRNVWRGLQTPKGSTVGWSARPVKRFDESVRFPQPGLVSRTVCYRSPEILNYLLLCPAARMEGYVLEREGIPMGYFLLAFTQNECRIAELWVASKEEDAWLSALLIAGMGREGNQVTVGCGTAWMRRVARRAGFHPIVRQPLYVKDPKGKLPGDLDAAFNLADTDAFLL